ncbi:MAG: DNA mismatch repair endonuclease MutL [Thermodesulfobacteriota bacterium]|jgi:DNA mismatch repair protein MutL
MGKIKSLPPEIIAKIAAGEVVERPASVVKELVENALDAGSRSVKVEVQGGGRKFIRVIDDGEGMTPEEALLSLQRYTTSKIDTLEDLFAIQTFGFRGEALSSVAAVSRLKIITRKDGQVSGVEIKMEGGTLLGSEETGCPPGTSVEVRDLFFNVPARLKFLKTVGTELSQIGEVMAKIALANPQTQFELFHEGKLLAHYPVRDDPASRIVEALGKEVAGKMYFFESRNGGVKVSGYAADPGLNRPNGRGLHLFVNRRPVRDRLLSHAVMESYRNLIPKDRYPVALLFVELPPSEVDVNVHPSKWEVKFSDSESVHRSVIRSVRGMLEKTPWLKEPPGQRGNELRESFDLYPHGEGKTSFPVSWPQAFRVESGTAAREPSSTFSFLGQIQQTYLTFSSPEGLLLVDQHAAHERILLEKLLTRFSQGALPKQPLLLPEVMDLPAEEAKIVEDHLADLARMGFEMEPSGRRTFWVKSTPEILADREPMKTLKEMIKEISSWGRDADLQRSFDPLLKMMACRGAIQAYRPMGREEAQSLLADLQNCTYPSHCPHGRPTLIKITLTELEKMFGRR